MLRANQWTLEKLLSWGLKNAQMEAWFFGRGWSVERFSAQVLRPYQFPLIGAPKAWCGGFEQPIEAEVVWLRGGAQDFEDYRGKLKGKIVLISPLRQVQPRFEPLATRMSETNLLRLANAAAPGQASGSSRAEYGPGERAARTPQPSPAASERSQAPAKPASPTRMLSFLAEEGAALAVSGSSTGDGGTFFVTSAMATPAASGGTNTNSAPVRLWSTNSPDILPQVTLAAEDYNRLARMIQEGEKPVMAVDLRVRYHTEDLMAYNTVAEIPGTDLKDEIVMVGGHLDSWHIGTGATDNAVGVTAAMEAMRILKALDLKPRRTIRIGLWAGEEEGLLGSKAYVAEHFGSLTNRPMSEKIATPKAGAEDDSAPAKKQENRVRRTRVVKKRDYDKLSAYFNLDNGAGKIRGIYLQGNEALRPLFREWLEPFSDLGASTISASKTGGTDHTSFDAIGLPGFQFIQDPLDYWSRTHHANQDVYERIVPDDLKQAATILAAFAYQAAMEEDRLPRKPAP